MKKITLRQAMEAAGTAVYLDRQKADAQFGPGLFDKAVAYHEKRNLRAYIESGTTWDRDGMRTRFVNYDGGGQYREAPHFVWFDFFRGTIMNSVSRLSRGLGA